jgi:hypothetical protein
MKAHVFHPYSKGNLTDAAPNYALAFIGAGQDDVAGYGRYPPSLSSSRDDLLARPAVSAVKRHCHGNWLPVSFTVTIPWRGQTVPLTDGRVYDSHPSSSADDWFRVRLSCL